MTVVDDIKSRLDVLEVVSHYVPLQRSGRSYKANCPFHQEKTPSFFVFPERQSWRCFGACATGGDVFSFVMRAENLEFPEVLKRLAQQAGVSLPDRERRSDQQLGLQINEAAAGYFQRLLAATQGVDARRYLERRGLTAETVEKFQLGLSPRDGASLKNHLVSQGFSDEQLALAGVVRAGDNGQYRDLFRGRLIIPIRDAQGGLVGFGGRALDDSNPKYLNSPKTPIFDKGRILYGLYLAKEAARQHGIVIVEGYIDAIMAHQHDFSNVVASMGTALTEHQVAEVRRLTGNITMALDPDPAGQQATLRSLESSWRVCQTRIAGHARGTTLYQRQETPALKVAVLPAGMDPDEVIRRSPEEWSRLVEVATPLLEYLLATLSAQVDLSTAQGKEWLAQALLPLIAAIPEPTQQDYYFRELAVCLGVSRETLKASMGRSTAVRRSRAEVPGARVDSPSAFAKLDRDPIEDYCLALLLQFPELSPDAQELRPEYFHRLENREIFGQWLRLTEGTSARCPEEKGGSGDREMVEALQRNLDIELSGHLEELAHRALPSSDRSRWTTALRDAVRRLEERYLRDLKAEEQLKFSEVPPEALEGAYEETLTINKRLRDNESKRNSSVNKLSPGR